MAVHFSHMGNNSIGATTMSSTTADTATLSVHRTRQVLVSRVTGKVPCAQINFGGNGIYQELTPQ